MANGSRSSPRARANQPDGAAAAAAPAYPPWVLLERFCTPVVRGPSIVDTKTVAAGQTTTNHTIAVALCIAPPPEGSRVCVQLPDGVQESPSAVLAAHGDSVLIKVPWLHGGVTDHFIYNAGDRAAATPRPPSLLLLPPIPRGCYHLDPDRTGLLRRGEVEFVVAELRFLRMPYEKKGTTRRRAVEVHLFRSGEWCVRRPPICLYDGGSEDGELASSWQNDVVVPVGDEMLCWVDLSRGLMFSKVFDESPRLLYVPLPMDHKFFQRSTRNVCVTTTDGGGVAVKFVNISPRCCCGDAAQSFCRRSHHAYTVHTWTLRMDDMTWVMDGLLDATQLWKHNSYKGLPRVDLDYPVVSMDEPHDICFITCDADDDNAMRVIILDMKSKTLRSAFRYPKALLCDSRQHLLPSRVSDYFNYSEPRSFKTDPVVAEIMVPISVREIPVEVEPKTNDIRKPLRKPLQPSVELSSGAATQASKVASPEAMILAALEEIPGLDRSDLLKAYRIHSHDHSGRLFRTLMELPMNLRKDCVLLDIRASEACFLCSACSADLQL